MNFDSRVSHLAVSCDNLILSVVTDDNKISLVDVRTLDNEPAVFSQGSLSAKCKCTKFLLSFVINFFRSMPPANRAAN